jgi:glycosyltransferase involved in cell wall biosynthesis
MKPRVGFVLEQALGHAAYGMSLRQALVHRTDLDAEWIDIPFAEGRFAKLPVVGAFARHWTLRGSLRARCAIAEAHHRRPFDVLFIHTQNIAMLVADYMAKIPTVLSLDATPLNYDELAHSYGHEVRHPSIELAKLFLYRALLRPAKRFTVWSEWTKDSLVRDYGVADGAVTVLHPGTMLANFPDPSTRGPRRPGPMRILFVGGDFKRKGGDLLLDIYRKHLAGSCELHLVSAVDVPEGDGVHVYREVKPHSETLLKLYADADVFVLPTRGDCLALVMAEAMASSLPIITTRVGAQHAAVLDGESGFLIDRDDSNALRDRLEHLSLNPALCRHMGSRSRQVGEARFDMYKNANKLADLLVGLYSPPAASRQRRSPAPRTSAP